MILWKVFVGNNDGAIASGQRDWCWLKEYDSWVASMIRSSPMSHQLPQPQLDFGQLGGAAERIFSG
jgi:hypothetical protein